MDNEENRQTYISKMTRQLREWEGIYADLQKKVRDRGATANMAVREEMEIIHGEMERTKMKLEELKAEAGDWPEQAVEVSESYKEMKESVQSTSDHVSKK